MPNITVLHFLQHKRDCLKSQGFANVACSCGLDDELKRTNPHSAPDYISGAVASYARHLPSCASRRDDMAGCDCGLSKTEEYQHGHCPA
jgi:hypothetical protein